MQFLPRDQVLSLEELERLASIFATLGVSKIRVTGGEPLVRRGVVGLLDNIGSIKGIKQLAVTTNGTQLADKAAALKAAGVTALNISLDTLNAEQFNAITRVGKLEQVLAGIDAACAQGFERVRINAVFTHGAQYQTALELVEYAIEKGIDIAFIEEMPLRHQGDKVNHDYASSQSLRSFLGEQLSLKPIKLNTGGPARYWQTSAGTSVGFISPMSDNFCGDCNRVRVTVEGRLLLCLGNEHSVDLRDLMRSTDDDQIVRQAIIDAMGLKPERHHFDLSNDVEVVRFMSETGG